MILELPDMVLELSRRYETYNGLTHSWLEGVILSGKLLVPPGGWLYLNEECLAGKFRVVNGGGWVKSEGEFLVLYEEADDAT